MTNDQGDSAENISTRRLVKLSAPGFDAWWMATPEQIREIIEVAGRCIADSNADVRPTAIPPLPPATGSAAATAEVVSWAQAVLTALNVGDVRSGSKLHLKLREVMIAYRASIPEAAERQSSAMTATCEHPMMGGLCGAPATHRGITSGDALCSECASQRRRWATEEVREEMPPNDQALRPGDSK